MMEVTPDRLKTEIEKATGFVLIDLQDAHEYAHSHIKGAVNVPLAQFETEALSLLRDKNQPVVVYESYDELGGGAKSAAYLEANGFTKVGRLTGGMRAWQNAGFITDGGMES